MQYLQSAFQIVFWLLFTINCFGVSKKIPEWVRIKYGLSLPDVERMRQHHEKLVIAQLIAAMFYYR